MAKNLLAATLMLLSVGANASVDSLHVIGSGACMPYSAVIDTQKNETLVDFGKKQFEKVSVTLINEEGYTKPATPRIIANTMYSFSGNYRQASIQVGKQCSFFVEKRKEETTDTKKQLLDENQKDLDQISKIEKQLASLVSKLEGSSFPAVQSAVPTVPEQPVLINPETTTGVQNKEPVVEREIVNKTPEVKMLPVEVKVTASDWNFDSIEQSDVNPIESWKRDLKRNFIMIQLKKGKGYEIIKARDGLNRSRYKWKENDFHVLELPTEFDDKISITIKDAKGKNFYYAIKTDIAPQYVEQKPIKEEIKIVENASQIVVKNDVPQKFAYLIKPTLRETLEEWKNNELDRWEIVYEGNANIEFGASALLNTSNFEDSLALIAPALIDAGVRFDIYKANKVLKVTIAK